MEQKAEYKAGDGFGQWAVVELLGHVKVAGYVTEEEHFGSKLGRIDVPGEEQTITQYFGGNTLYRLTPVTEEVARAFAARSSPRPVHVYELLPPEPRPTAFDLEDGEELGSSAL